MTLSHAALFLSAVLAFGQSASNLKPDPPKTCSACDEWNRPSEAFRLYGNTYYVGTRGLSALLVTSDEGHILLDGALPQSAPLIEANIRALGFRLADVKLIVNSHAHFDHAGGLNALQRASGAEVAASASGVKALEAGMPTADDPQFAYGDGFPAVSRLRVVKDGEVVRVGPLAITAHLTPGHTPGSTAWTWRSCEGDRCLNMVYADSLTAVSAPEFRYTADAGRVAAFRRSIDTVAALPCDIVVSTHPEFTAVPDKLARRKAAPGTNPFLDSNGCRDYAAVALKRLEQRLRDENPK